MTDFAAGLTGFLAADPIAETVRALDDPFTAEGVPARVREARRHLDKAPPEKRAQMEAGLQLLGELYGSGAAPAAEGIAAAALDRVRAWLQAAFEAWRVARTDADRTELARDVARALGGREDGAARLAPFFSGWGGEPGFAAEVLAEWPRLDAGITAAASRAIGLLGAGDEAWPRLAAGHGLMRARIGAGGAELALEDPPAPEGVQLEPERLAELARRRAERRDLAGAVVEAAMSGASTPFAAWEAARDARRLSAVLVGLAPFARDEARARQVQDALAAATRVLEDERLAPERQPDLPALARAAMGAIVRLGRKLKPDPALACIRAATAALERSSPPGLAEAVEVQLAQDAVLGALASLPPAVALEPLLLRVNACLVRGPAREGPGFARAVGHLLGSDAPGARAERLAPILAWLGPALTGEGRPRVLAALALWEALDRCVLAVGTAFARTWYAGTSSSGAPPLATVALAALDVVFPGARLDPARLSESADRLQDKVRTRAQELLARPALGEATRRAALLWIEATAMLERGAIEAASAALGPDAFGRRPLAEKVELLQALTWLLQGDVLPGPRVEAGGLRAARALYAPDQEAARDLPASAVRGLDAARWRTLAQTLSGARRDPVLADALLLLAHRQRPARPGDAPGASRGERVEAELAALLRLVHEDLPARGQERLGEGLALGLARELDAAREQGQVPATARSLAHLLAARPATRLVAWAAAAAPDPLLRGTLAAGAAFLGKSAGTEARLRLPAEAGGPFAAALAQVDEAVARLRAPAQGEVASRKRLAELGEEVHGLARALDGLRRLLRAPSEGPGEEDGEALARLAGRPRQALVGAAELALGDAGGRGELLDAAEAGLRELAEQVRALAPAPEHRRSAAALEGWAQAVAAHRERFATRVDQLRRAGQFEAMLELGWDDPDDVVRVALEEPRHRRLLDFLRRYSERHPERLKGTRAAAAHRACEVVRRGLILARDLEALQGLAWEPAESLLAAGEEVAGGRHEVLLAFLRDLGARRKELDLSSPAARRAADAIRVGFLRAGDLAGLAAAMQATPSGPLAWTPEAREALLAQGLRELRHDPAALQALLAAAARPGPGAPAAAPGESPAWRAALQRLVEVHKGRGDHAALAALMTGPEAGAYRWSGAFAGLHQLVTNPAVLLVAAAPFVAARFAPGLVPGLFLGLFALLALAAVWLLAGSPLQREACFPGLLGRIAAAELLMGLLARASAVPPVGGRYLLGLVALCGFGAWLLLAAAHSRHAPPGCAVRGALGTLSLGVLQALGLAMALSLLLPPWFYAGAGVELAPGLFLRPGLVLGWTALGVMAGAALERAQRA